MTPSGEIRAALDPKSSWDIRATKAAALPPGAGWPGELERVEAGPLELPRGGQRHVQDRAEGEIAVGPEVAVAGEVAEAVGDKVPAVELDAPQHMRAARDHQACAGVDGHMSPTAAMVTGSAAAAPVLPGGAGADGRARQAVAGYAGAAVLAMADVRPRAVVCAASGAVNEQAVRLIAPTAPATAARRSQSHEDIVEAGRADGQRPRGSGQTAVPIRSRQGPGSGACGLVLTWRTRPSRVEPRHDCTRIFR